MTGGLITIALSTGGSGSNLGTKTVYPDTSDRTYNAVDDNLDGYYQFTVKKTKSEITGTFSQNGEYYPPAGSVWNHVIVSVDVECADDATLDQVTEVIPPEYTILPDNGTSYIPDVYLAVSEIGSTDWIRVSGKTYSYIDHRTSAVIRIDIKDASTGQSITGYPRNMSSWSGDIRSGGYLKLDKWTVTSNNELEVFWRWTPAGDVQEQSFDRKDLGAGNYLTSYVNGGPYHIQ